MGYEAVVPKSVEVLPSVLAISGRSVLDEAHVNARTNTLQILKTTGEKSRYDPMASQPALYLTFAQTEVTEAAICTFVGKFGPLGISRAFRSPDGTAVTGEPLYEWGAEIYALRGAVYRAEILAGRIVAGWQKFVIKRTIRERRSGLSREARRRVYRREVRQWLEVTVNDRLVKHVASTLSPRYGDAAPFQISQQPRTLLGALWLQAAHALAGHRAFRPCLYCGRLLEITTEPGQRGLRSDARYCPDDNCRTKHWLSRQAHARRLLKEGRKRSEIAAELEVSGAQVAAWLRTSKESSRSAATGTR